MMIIILRLLNNNKLLIINHFWEYLSVYTVKRGKQNSYLIYKNKFDILVEVICAKNNNKFDKLGDEANCRAVKIIWGWGAGI